MGRDLILPGSKGLESRKWRNLGEESLRRKDLKTRGEQSGGTSRL
jgi:hypothetical protein